VNVSDAIGYVAAVIDVLVLGWALITESPINRRNGRQVGSRQRP
jgi:hypothetical protein